MKLILSKMISSICLNKINTLKKIFQNIEKAEQQEKIEFGKYF